MEQITRRDDVFYYGDHACRDADDAYCRFRNDYHKVVGRKAFERLNRLGQRAERIHERGFVFSSYSGSYISLYPGRVEGRLLGLVGTSYCRIIGGWDVHCGTDEEFDRWLDWALSEDHWAVRMVGKKDKAGRTSKRLKARYR